MMEFLRGKDQASIKEIMEGTRLSVGEAPESSYRSSLQDERFFERVQRGVYRLRNRG